MKRSAALSAPVVSLLSPSPAASRRAQELFASIFGTEHKSLDLAQDELDDVFHSRIPGLSRKWDSVASKCFSSDAIIHFCSLEAGSNSDSQGPFSLLAVTDAPSDSTTTEAVGYFRHMLASQVKNQATNIKLRQAMGSLTASQLLGSASNAGLPLLNLPNYDVSTSGTDDAMPPGSLKEIVLPAYDYAVYADGSSLLSHLSDSQLRRPKTGVYRWTASSTCIRPLPTAPEDQRLPPPSLIFHCSNFEEIIANVHRGGAMTAKIGYNGVGDGQLMVLHKDLQGLDLRYCSKADVSSSFAEAQESLLAASLEDLQSTNTLLAGGEEAKDDARLGNADCWIEVRANVKRPSGFWRRTLAKPASKQRVAKAPDIPYE